MLSHLLALSEEIKEALVQTAFMEFTSLVIAIIFGGALGLLLYITSNSLFVKNEIANSSTQLS